MEEKKPEPAPESQPSLVEGALKASEALKLQNDRMEQNIKKLEELKSVELLGGQTNAGVQPEPPKEETPQEYVKKVMSGKL